MIEQKIAEVLLRKFEEDQDFHSCFLVDVSKGPKSHIVVYIDADDGLTIDTCRKISRLLEEEIESNGWMPEKYTLDVSSPGLDNPLKLRRQYVKNIGRKAEVQLLDGRKQIGTIINVSEDQIEIASTQDSSESIGFDQISKTFILVSFK